MKSDELNELSPIILQDMFILSEEQFLEKHKDITKENYDKIIENFFREQYNIIDYQLFNVDISQCIAPVKKAYFEEAFCWNMDTNTYEHLYLVWATNYNTARHEYGSLSVGLLKFFFNVEYKNEKAYPYVTVYLFDNKKYKSDVVEEYDPNHSGRFSQLFQEALRTSDNLSSFKRNFESKLINLAEENSYLLTALTQTKAERKLPPTPF